MGARRARRSGDGARMILAEELLPPYQTASAPSQISFSDSRNINA